MLASSLPTDITLHIASYLPYSTLTNVSLVCKNWRLGILPALFRSTLLENDQSIANFSRTIALDDELGFPSISQFIRSLSISNWSAKTITDSGLVPLVSCVPRLVHLVRLHWRITFVPADINILELFQTNCAQLRWVSLLIPDGYEFERKLEESHYAILLSFRNLSEFRLQVHHIPPDVNTKAFRPLKRLISNCPGLELLQLYLYDPQPVHYTLEDVATWLGDEVDMPSLRRLHLLGSVRIDAASLVSSPGTGAHYFREFLARHKNIEELYLDCVNVNSFPGTTDPEDLARALPFLRSFAGPDFLCDILVRSSVAGQLECLSIQKCCFKAGRSFISHGPHQILPLPKLRELVVETKMYYQVLTILELILPAAPGLENLGLPQLPPPCHDIFLELVTHTPGLQKTSIFNSVPCVLNPTVPCKLTAGDVAQRRLSLNIVSRRSSGAQPPEQPKFTVLEPYITRLAQLRRFHCELLTVPENSTVFRLLQIQCPQLKSVSLSIDKIDLGTEKGQSQLEALFGFSHLKDYSLTIHEITPSIDSNKFGPIKALATNCPELESLILNFSFDDSGTDSPYVYTPDALATSFGEDLTMPSLRRLHLCGEVEMDASSLFGSPTTGSHPFRDFLSCHPHIVDLKLECSSIRGFEDRSLNIDPEHLARALPSLRHLSAPDFICSYLVSSTAATRLESLVTMEELNGPMEIFEAYPMPMLRKLYLDFDIHLITYSLSLMRSIMSVANGLEELRLNSIPEFHHTELLKSLSHAPRLQKLGTCGCMHDSAYKALADAIKSRYPKLSIVSGLGHGSSDYGLEKSFARI
ncbi:unnamed protein product, partial [Rhizoctonia solani]